MSILHLSPNQNVSSILHSLLQAKPADVEWRHYTQLVEQQDDSDETKLNKALNRKRAMARKFLRIKSDKSSENSYRKDASCVFTPKFVKDLGNANAARRSRCNPWLESWISEAPRKGAADSDFLTSFNENVVPFGPQIGPQTGAQLNMKNKTVDFPR